MSGPTYTYNSMTPNAPDRMNDTQPQILANFQAINELLGVNHVAWTGTDSSTNFGAHNLLTMPNQSPIPTPTNVAVNMYSAVTGAPNPCELFIQYPDGVTSQISDQPQPTYGVGTSSGNATQGWCTFPSGFSLRWGTFTTPPIYPNGAGSIITFTSGPLNSGYWIDGPFSPTSAGCQNPTSGLMQPYSTTINQFAGSFSNTSGSTTAVSFNYSIIIYTTPN